MNNNKNNKDKEPLFSITKKDCRWDYYVGSGKGGQKRNKTANCVRCTHEASGAVGKSEEGRSQAHNKRQAFLRMAESPIFKGWVHLEKSRRLGIEARIENDVEKEMQSKNIRVEVKNAEGKWVEDSDNS